VLNTLNHAINSGVVELEPIKKCCIETLIPTSIEVLEIRLKNAQS
jgi:hypothetical protein